MFTPLDIIQVHTTVKTYYYTVLFINQSIRIMIRRMNTIITTIKIALLEQRAAVTLSSSPYNFHGYCIYLTIPIKSQKPPKTDYSKIKHKLDRVAHHIR